MSQLLSKPVAGRRTQSVRRLRVVLLHPELTVLAVIVGLSLYLGLTNEFFFQRDNLLNITEAVSVIGIAAASQRSL